MQNASCFTFNKSLSLKHPSPAPLSSGPAPGESMSPVPGPSCHGRLRGGSEAISMPCREEERSLLAGEELSCILWSGR